MEVNVMTQNKEMIDIMKKYSLQKEAMGETN